MLPADMGGGGAAPIAATQYDFDRIKELATKRGTVWQEKAEAGHTTLSKIELDQDSFSAIDSCQRFGTAYAAAHQIYLETLAGVQKDLAAYQAKLLKVAESMRLHDDRAADVFAGFNQPAGHASLASDAAYLHASGSSAANEAEDAQTKAQDDRQQIAADRLLEEQRRAQSAAAGTPQHRGGPDYPPTAPAPSPQSAPQPTTAQDAAGDAP